PSLDLADCKSKEGDRLFSGSSAGHRVVDEEAKTSHTKATQQCRMRVLLMRFMRDIIMDPSLGLRISMPRETRKLHTPKKH
ncbi:hypothetical protein Prudu_461S000300, partial [Prunus dulcis]